MENRAGWIPDGHDFILHLGTMRKAVVVAGYSDSHWKFGIVGYYAVSPRSYFPFTKEQYAEKFLHADEAMIFAEQIIKEWVQSILIGNKCLQQEAN